MKELNKDKILENLPLDRLNIDIFDEIDSTNDEAKRINLEKDFHIIIAEKQNAGRGRLGKKWSSPNSGNIYMTICTENDLSFMPLSLILGLICKEAIEEISQKSEIKLKWPNDILYKNKKIGGILVEKEIKNNDVKSIIGIGINLNIKKEELWWGDLSEYKLESKRNSLINIIISKLLNFKDSYDESWINEWKNACAHLNKEVEIYEGKKFIEKTIFKDIDLKGNAILENKNGIEKIGSGQISIKGIY